LFNILRNSLMHIDPTRTYSPSTVNSLFNEFVTLKPDVNLMHLNKAEVFWEFSHLLFPPVQDGRIAKCINEPSKMIAEPFTPNILRTINGHKMKSTLLEAVIRIRLDIISGTQIASPSTEPGSVRPPITAGNFSVPVSHKSIIEKMGLIESLIIIRLFTAVQGFAFDVYSRIGDMVSLQHQNSNVPKGDLREDNEASGIEKKKFCETNDERCQLESMKLIEDSMLLILGDSDVPGVLDMQVGVARSSGMKNAHLMSAVLAIMDVPRRYVESKLASLDEEQEKAAEKAADAAKSAIANKIGISKGVGAIDVLAFLIALFTMKESELLCLLTSEQFENLEGEYPDGFFSDFTREMAISVAVNRVTNRAYDAYQLFRHALSKQG